MDIDVRLRMFTWFADVSGAVAVSRMGPEDISRARARRMSHNVFTSRVFGPMPRGVFVTDRVADTDAGSDPDAPLPPAHRPRACPSSSTSTAAGARWATSTSPTGCAPTSPRGWAPSWSRSTTASPPSTRYPAGREDGYAAVTWVARHAAALGARTDRLAVMGDSAGGNLAAVVCLLAREAGPVIDAQVLLYPALDLTFTPTVGRALRRRARCSRAPTWRSSAPTTSGEDGDADRPAVLSAVRARTSPTCRRRSSSPPRSTRCTTTAPTTSARLGAAGVPVKHTDHARAVHGFLSFPGVCRASAAALDDVCAELTVRLA